MDNGKDPRNEDDQLIGKAIESRYEVVRLIDAGGMASVYRAWDRRLQRDVALKIMHPHLAHNAKLIARFEAEAQATAKLTHSHIVQIFDQGVWRGRSYLVMEFINGPSLRRYLAQKNTLPVAEALKITQAILLALDHAHKCQIMHRDIKPENILITPKHEIKVVDFGLAHAINQATGATTGQIMGTVCYIAPEVITRDFSDERSDLYAVGVMLFEMLYGKLPFATSTSISAVWAQVNQDIPPLTQLLTDFPPAVSRFVTQLCQRDLTQRYRQAIAAAEDSAELLNVLPSAALDYRYVLEDSASLPTNAHKTEAFPVFTLEDESGLASGLADPGQFSSSQSSSSIAPDSAESDPSFNYAEDPGREAVSFPNLEAAGESPQATGVVLSDTASLENTLAMPVTQAVAAASRAASPASTAAASQAEAANAKEAADISAPGSAEPKLDFAEVISAPQTGRKKQRRLLGLVLLAVGVIALGSGLGWYFLYGPGAKVTIPDVSGKTQTQAAQILRQSELKPQVKEDFSDTIAPGKAIGTNPKTGQKIRKNSAVDLLISKGVEMVKVPDLRNKDLAEVKSLLAKNKLKLGKTTAVFDEEIAKDKISAQSLEIGSSVKHDSVIDLNISKGREPFQVPEVTHKPLAEAKQLLEAAHLVIEVEETFSDEIARGLIISQDVNAGEERYRGDKVKVQLSLGPEYLTMPSLAGKAMDEAKAEAERLGFKVNIEKQLLGISPGRVYSQYPGAGTRVRSGSTITLTYV